MCTGWYARIFAVFWSFFGYKKRKRNMKRQNKQQSTHSGGSSGVVMPENPTLVKKGIRTFYGIVEDSLENKKENYDEICHTEDRRIVNAAIALRSRLSSKEREIAQEWYSNFNTLVGGWMC